MALWIVMHLPHNELKINDLAADVCRAVALCSNAWIDHFLKQEHSAMEGAAPPLQRPHIYRTLQLKRGWSAASQRVFSGCSDNSSYVHPTFMGVQSVRSNRLEKSAISLSSSIKLPSKMGTHLFNNVFVCADFSIVVKVELIALFRKILCMSWWAPSFDAFYIDRNPTWWGIETVWRYCDNLLGHDV